MPIGSNVTLPELISRLRQILAEQGVLGGIRTMLKLAYRRVRPRVARPHPFDARHGVDTSGLIVGRELRSSDANAGHITAYWGTAPSLFEALMKRWQEDLPAGLRIEDFAFVDIGCGKGRVVMLASEFSFQQVTGVELNAPLAEIAGRNLQVWKVKDRACPRIAVVQADALSYPLPEEPLLIYMFNPFDRPVVKEFVDRLVTCATKRTAPIDVMYVFPFHAECFLHSPTIELLWDIVMPFSLEDASVDVFQARQERCHLYRISPQLQDVSAMLSA